MKRRLGKTKRKGELLNNRIRLPQPASLAVRCNAHGRVTGLQICERIATYIPRDFIPRRCRSRQRECRPVCIALLTEEPYPVALDQLHLHLTQPPHRFGYGGLYGRSFPDGGKI